MKVLKVFVVFILCSAVYCLLPTSLHAQAPKSFSSDSVKFLNEMDDWFSSVKGKEKEGHDFIKEQFKSFWFGGYLSDEKRKFVYVASNTMLQKKFRPYPDYNNFFMAMINFYNVAKLQESSFLSWKASIEKLLWTSSAKKLSDFLEFSADLFASNTLYRSNYVEWFSGSNNYSFEYDSLPKIIFSETNIFCAVKADTASIFGTSGTYYPTEKKWVGKGGKVTWERDGIDAKLIHAELGRYTVILTKQSYIADSVKFTNEIYFKTPILGKLEEKAVPDATPENAIYPRFESYSTRFEIKNIAQGKVDFSGGFSLRGSRFIGSGNKTADAYLIFKRNNQSMIKASGKTFIFKKDRISSDDAAITMYLEKDSIYHPSIKVKFDIDTKELVLIRILEGISKTPYFNTFHKVDMYVEEIDWKLDSANMYFKTLLGSSQGIAEFASASYFRAEVFYQLLGIDQVHPLSALKSCAEQLKRKEFTVEEFSKCRRLDPNAIRPSLIAIANLGFIIYKPEEDMIIMQDRLYQFLKAKAGAVDYDVIGIHSDVHGGSTNAVLNLLNYDLKIFGVSEIFLSDSQNVFLYPSKKQIVLKKNRDFAFGGVMNAGRFTIFGKDFVFNYDQFKIKINNADSLRFSVRRLTPDAFGNSPNVPVKSVIEEVQGELFIDRPSNKSGRMSFHQYPIFNSSKESFVYYSKRSIQRGVYKRDKFYFKIDPYSLDSLDDFKTEALKLKGTLASAGIFPDFVDTLSIQPDYSLGFIRPAPQGGFAAYGNKGKFNNKIKLSNEGLRGDGTIEYLTSTAKSSNVIFFPDSMNGLAETFEVQEQKAEKTEYPHVKGDSVYIHWTPKKDLMQVYSQIKPMDFYNGQAQMKGRVDYSSNEMAGNGKLTFSSASMSASLMKFKNTKVLSDTANFSLKSLQSSQFAFSTKNVNAIVDFEKRTGDFASNGKGSIVEFPVNQYICYMDNFKWYMDNGDIEMTSRDAKKPKADQLLELSGPEFISTNPKQDSLRFNAPKAKFDFKNYIISAQDVAWINVADAKIYPDSGKVTILKAAEMKTFSNAKIVANSVTAYHSIYKANVNIFARKNYSASGYYDYVDEMKNKQPLYLANIRVDTTYQTIAEAIIPDSLHFMLSPNYEFRGKMNLASNNQFMVFTGSAKITHTCAALGEGKTWFQFSSQINPEKILIPITDKLDDDKGKTLGAAIMVAADTSGIYSAFLTKKIRKTDFEVLAATGFLFYDRQSKEYRIASKEKLNEPSLAGNYLSLKSNSCTVYGEGKMGTLGLDFGQVKIDVVGNASHDLKIDSAEFNMMIALDFFFENPALEKMSDLILNNTTLTGVAVGTTFEKGLHELLGKEKADKLISEVNLYGKFKRFPEELEHSIFFTDVHMVWDDKNNAYVSDKTIGIGFIRKNQINKYVQGKIAMTKKRSGDVLDIYLEIDNNNWYYFRYTKGLLTAIASDQEFNKSIQELKSDKRSLKTERGQTPYTFSIGSDQQKKLFLRKFKNVED
ncbi:MAG: hypothetical protein HY840_08515 [Bacteroidetes bacterium]|nr:hypothetical protein [Bacteroidota bacterium]